MKHKGITFFLFSLSLVILTAVGAWASDVGIISTVAGNGTAGFGGDGGPAVDAMLNDPHGIGMDAQGNLYIADTLTSTVRKVDTSGVITTVAGIGHYCYDSPDGVPATSVCLQHPIDVTADSKGNVIFVDRLEGKVRKIDAVSGIISTVAGGGGWDRTTDGIPATNALFLNPVAVALDGADNIYIASLFENRVRKVDAVTGTITTVAGGGPLASWWDYQGNAAGDGGPATEAELFFPNSVALDEAGNIYISDGGNHLIRKVDAATGIITTIAGTGVSGYSGDGGPATQAQLYGPSYVETNKAGNIYFSDAYRLRKIDAVTGIVTTIAGTGESGFSGEDIPALQSTLYSRGIAFSPTGDLYVVDEENNRVRKIVFIDQPTLDITSFGPAVIWPPNNKTVNIYVSCVLTPVGEDGLPELTYSLEDEYGVHTSSGSVDVNPDGTFAAAFPVTAGRDDDDTDGRHYTITLSATNIAGTAEQSVEVTVPYDQSE